DRAAKRIADLIEKHEVPPAFSVAWDDHLHDLDAILRLYDFFLASHPLMPLYFSAAWFCNKQDRLLSLPPEDIDFAVLHSLPGSTIPIARPIQLETVISEACRLFYPATRRTTCPVPVAGLTKLKLRPSQQLEAVVPLSLLISLSDGTVSVHNLDTLKALSVLDNPRRFPTPADPGQAEGGRQANLRLCVHVKQRPAAVPLGLLAPSQFAELRAGNSPCRRGQSRQLDWPQQRSASHLKTDYFRIRRLQTMFVNEKGRWRRRVRKSNDGPLMRQVVQGASAAAIFGPVSDWHLLPILLKFELLISGTSLIQNWTFRDMPAPLSHTPVQSAAQRQSAPRPGVFGSFCNRLFAGLCPSQSNCLLHRGGRPWRRRDFVSCAALRLHEIGQSDPDRAGRVLGT
uniref:Nucleotidyltransferase family protein n=1 Tax=Macrostomum lignano TaxID=282301 RepID=A0A1I8F9V8_9PLAT